MPKFTIGMAHHNDFHGVYFTIQALRMYFPEFVKRCEFVVVNNGPENNHTQMISGLMANVSGSNAARLIQQSDPVGTSSARNRIFAEARGDYVIAMDCHVLLMPGSLEVLEDYFDENPNTPNLVSGPMVYDNLQGLSTHFNDEWRSEMWGTWGMAWHCPECNTPESHFSVRQENSQAVAIDLTINPLRRISCLCGRDYPAVAFGGHEKHFQAAGFVELTNQSEPFAIPGMGLGFYACRRDQWRGFNVHARAFGGEELWYHEKVRRAGGQAVCHPLVRWVHRFGRPDGVPYPLDSYNKIRNYVLEFVELGMDTTPIQNHFVGAGKISSGSFAALLADPVHQTIESAAPCPTCTKPAEPLPVFDSITSLFAWQTNQERDLNQHMPELLALGSQCSQITEFSHRRDSLIAFLAAEPETLVSYNTETGVIPNLAAQLAKAMSLDLTLISADSPAVQSIDWTDLLFIDTQHSYERVTSELAKFAKNVRRYLVFHDTESFGVRGDDGGPGLIQAIADFLKANKSWFLYSHTKRQYGLTVLATLECSIPEKPVSDWVLGFGPGTELHKLLGSIGIHPTPECPCIEMMREMDAWGLAGCLKYRDMLIDTLETRQNEFGWAGFFTAGLGVLLSGLALKINPIDPITSLFDLAVEKAKA